MFSKREYEYVREIAKEGSFSKAAQKLYISQPALSGAIKKIEKELYGISLFDRNVNPVALTPAGQYYLEKRGRYTSSAMRWSSILQSWRVSVPV